ncbi:MAG TPA: hypothetical protein VGX78_12515 [Pirellulales bacterium]|jgi:hypothetical protein|nr:hypothetical protein [Pirellulales bacterium]
MRKFFETALALAILVPWASAAPLADENVKLVPEEGAVEIMLLRQPSVQKELKLTDGEAEKILSHANKQWKAAHEASKLEEPARDKKFVEMTKENERFLDETLEKEQRKRLDQITLQVAGLLCVTRPNVASKLALTDEQKKRAAQFQQEARAEMEALIHTESDETKQEKLRELRQTSRKRLLDLLTDKQEATWKELTGEPFHGEILFNHGVAAKSAGAN